MLGQANIRNAPDGEHPDIDQAASTHAAPVMPRSIFETADYRTVYGVDRVVEVDPGDGVPLVFHDRGDHAVCLARTASLDAGMVEKASQRLFATPRFRFVVFEDVHLPSPARTPSASLSFRYQNDWVLPVGGQDGGLRHSFNHKMDKKLRRMAREYGDIRLEIEERPSSDIVNATIEFNRERIEASGHSYRMDDTRRERLASAFSRIGIAAVLRHGDRFVAADLFVECGKDAYAILGGYDNAYHRDSPGMQTMRHAVEHFQNRGFENVHFLWGDGSYKGWLGAQCMPLSTVIVPRSPGEWLGPRMLRVAARYGFRDLKRRAKEHGLDKDAVKKFAQWPRRLQMTQRLAG